MAEKKDNKREDDEGAEKSARKKFNYYSSSGKPDKVIDPETGTTWLMDAVKQRKFGRAARLLQDGAKPNLIDKKGYSAMHYAVMRGDTRMVQLLADNGGDINMRDRKGVPPFFHAMKTQRKPAFLQAMIDAGADPDAALKDGRTAMHYAITESTPETIALLLKTMKNPDQPDEKGVSPLFLAAEHGSTSLLQVLLYERVDLMRRDDDGRNVLHYAARKEGDTDNLKFLLTRTKAVSLINATGGRGNESVFHIVTDRNDAKMIRLMLKLGGDPNLRDGSHESVMSRAAAKCDLDTVKLLVSKGGDAGKPGEQRGRSPLLSALRNNRKDVASYLVDQGADLESRPKYGEGPLLAALNQGMFDLAEQMLDMGANPATSGHNGNDCLSSIGRDWPDDLVRKLVEHGSDVNGGEKTGYNSGTPLSTAVRMGNVGHVKLLLELGAKPNTDTYAHNTPLMIAVHGEDPKMVEMLLDAGADPNDEAYRNDASPLFTAVSYGSEKITKLLLDAGADPNVTNYMNEPLLTTAIERSFRENAQDMVKILLDAGADPRKKSRYGGSPLEVARRRNMTETVKLMEDFIRKHPKPPEDDDNKPPPRFRGPRGPGGPGGAYYA